MTADQMKTALKMMADFAPAFMKAQEILDSVEQAQASIELLNAESQEASKKLQSVNDAIVQQETELAKALADLDSAKRDMAAQKQKLNDGLAAVSTQYQQKKDALDEMNATYAERLSGLDEQIGQKQSELDGLKHELEALVTKLRS